MADAISSALARHMIAVLSERPALSSRDFMVVNAAGAEENAQVLSTLFSLARARSLSRSLSRSHALTLSLSLARALSLSRSRSRSLTLTLTLTLSGSLQDSHSLNPPLPLFLPYSLNPLSPGRCAYLPSVTCYRQSIKPPPPLLPLSSLVVAIQLETSI